MQASEKRRGLVDVSSMTAQHRRLKLHKLDRMFDNPALVCCSHFHTNRKAMGRVPNWAVDHISLVHDRKPGRLPMAAALLWVCSPCECQSLTAVGLSVSPPRTHLIQEPVRLLEGLPLTGEELEAILKELINQAHPQDHVGPESRPTREVRRVAACVL